MIHAKCFKYNLYGRGFNTYLKQNLERTGRDNEMSIGMITLPEIEMLQIEGVGISSAGRGQCARVFSGHAANATDTRECAEKKGNLSLVNALDVGRRQLGVDLVDMFLRDTRVIRASIWG